MASFLRLPVELKMEIMSTVHINKSQILYGSSGLIRSVKITRPADLKSLALVSVKMHDFVTPYLYREVVVRYGDAAKLATLRSLLKSRYGPLIHGVMLVQEAHSNESQRYLGLSVKEILSHLPDNSLARLEWDGAAALDLELLRALWQHHRQFRYFRLPPAALLGFQESIASSCRILRSLGSVIEMDLRLGNSIDERQALDAVENLDMSRLRELTLGSEGPNQQESHRPLDTLPQGLFSNMLPTTLVVIRLVEIDLSANGRSSGPHGTLDCIQLSVLKRLEILDCSNADELLLNWCVPGLTHFELRLQSYSSSFDGQSHWCQTKFFLDMFLLRCDCLETLIICTAPWGLPISTDAISRHASTLRILLSNHRIWEPAETNLKELKVLRQLAVSFCSIGCIMTAVQAEYYKAIVEICISTPVRTLHFISLPALGKIDLRAPLQSYRKKLHDFADMMFRETAGSELRVLAFGTDNEYYWPHDLAPKEVTNPNRDGRPEPVPHTKRLCFMRRPESKTSADGSGLAVQVDEKEVKWLVAESDVLQYSFRE